MHSESRHRSWRESRSNGFSDSCLAAKFSYNIHSNKKILYKELYSHCFTNWIFSFFYILLSRPSTISQNYQRDLMTALLTNIRKARRMSAGSLPKIFWILSFMYPRIFSALQTKGQVTVRKHQICTSRISSCIQMHSWLLDSWLQKYVPSCKKLARVCFLKCSGSCP